MSLPLEEQKTQPPSDSGVIPQPPLIGKFAGYELISEIARGGMGVVYKARQPELDRLVALKMILSGTLASAEDVKRFRDEAAAAAGLRHANIVSIYEVSECEGQHFFAMSLIDGESLSFRVARRPLPPREAAEIMSTVARAIHHAHVNGVVHRDIKPANILIDREGVPFVTDFGLAKKRGRDGQTREGEFMGTAGFLPPEQATGESAKIDERSDVYSLGATLYCLLTGNPPFNSASHVDTLFQVMNREPMSLRRLDESIPMDLDTISLKCLEKNPDRRFQTAIEFADELDRFLNGHPIHSRPISTTTRFLKWVQRHRLLASLVAVLALTNIALIISMGRFATAITQAEQKAAAAEKSKQQTEEVLNDLIKRSRIEVKEPITFPTPVGPTPEIPKRPATEQPSDAG